MKNVFVQFGFKLLLAVLLLQPNLVLSQSGNYWSGNFNEESALVSGAVVGGGAGPSAIYYNPAGIAEIEESKLSINASLFSYDYFKAKNAWGEDIDYISTRFVVVPRFVSFMLQPKNNPNLSLEFAFLNNENYQVDNVGSVDEFIDVLEYLPGKERYNAYYRYDQKYRDDWLGAGGSYKINSNLFLGTSMFVSVRSLNYSYTVDIEAGKPLVESTKDDPFFTAKYKDQEYLKFNNYRVLWKFGLLYKMNRLNLGLNITTPSINVYADEKSVMRKKTQSNITNPETNEPVLNYLVSDYAEKKKVHVNHKSPFAIALGLTWQNKAETKTIYSTVEYFGGISPYRMVEAEEKFDISSGSPEFEVIYDDWLSYAWGTNPVFNAALGYRWLVGDQFLFMAGFRTDFSYRKNYEYFPLEERRALKGFAFDRYHVTGGFSTKVLGQDLMAGIQYTLGVENNQRQFINLSDPVEYDPIKKTALQGTRQNNMNSILNSISFYFGATFNLGGDGEM